MIQLGSAFVFLSMAFYGHAQMGSDMQLIFQELGVELPPMPPSMPQSLREHLYPQQRQQQQQQQQQWQLRLLQQRRLAALRAAQLQNPPNPYSLTYRQSRRQVKAKHANSVYSSANRIRTPPANALMGKVKASNPYGQVTSRPANPYSRSRLAAKPTTMPTVMPTLRTPILINTIRQARDQNKKIREAKVAGCKLPLEGPAGMALGTCKQRNARLVCQSMLLACNDVGLVAMCCPYGMNQLTRDTLSYVKKLQTYVSEVA